MTKLNKRTEVKFETAKEFVIQNRNLVYTSIKNKFRFLDIELKDIASKYLGFILNGKYNTTFATIINKKDVAKLINYSVGDFAAQMEEVLKTDFNAVNDFEDERRRDAYASKSI